MGWGGIIFQLANESLVESTTGRTLLSTMRSDSGANRKKEKMADICKLRRGLTSWKTGVAKLACNSGLRTESYELVH